MAHRIRIRSDVFPLFSPDETIQAVFQAQTSRDYLPVAAGAAFLLEPDPRRIIVVTDRRILVCYAGRFRPALVRGVEREVPRATRIGPPRGFWWRCHTLGGRLYVQPQFHEEIRRADQALLAA